MIHLTIRDAVGVERAIAAMRDANVEMPVVTGLRLGLVSRAIAPAIEEARAAMRKLVEQHAVVGPDGRPTIDEAGHFRIRPEGAAQFDAANRQIEGEAVQIAVAPLTPDQLPAALPMQVIEGLLPLILSPTEKEI